MQTKIKEVIDSGDTPNFKGLFWFQGESDGQGIGNGPVPLYAARSNGMLAQLNTDIGSSSTQLKIPLQGIRFVDPLNRA